MTDERVEEMEASSALEAEQSAAWREVVREAMRGALQLGWAYWVYLIVRLLVEALQLWVH